MDDSSLWTVLARQALSPRWLGAVSVTLAYAALCVAVVRRHVRRQAGRALAHASLRAGPATTSAEAGTVWVLYASQTGQTEALAWQSAQALHAAGCPVRIQALGELREADLRTASRMLFIVSTHGEGNPPDNALAFVRDCMDASPPTLAPLTLLHYAVLALGDRDYRHFCGFGRALDEWLQARGASPMQPRIDVHRDDAQALRAWQAHLGRLAGTTDLPDWQTAAAFEPYRLIEQHCLNPGSAGQPVYHLALVPRQGPLPHWEAGDLVQITPPGEAGGRPREYSIANAPGDGSVQLLVRRHAGVDAQGQPHHVGRVSGWLTAPEALRQPILLRVRAHPNFRLGENAHRPLILVGNGTGLAGLRAHLQLRAQAVAAAGGAVPGRCAWLLFGERAQKHDQFHAAEVAAWQASGVLSEVDWVFSHDQRAARPPQPPHVQDRLRARAQRLREWVDADAAIYVCGSLHGMATGVDAALREVLGEACVDELLRSGRLRRDVY